MADLMTVLRLQAARMRFLAGFVAGLALVGAASMSWRFAQNTPAALNRVSIRNNRHRKTRLDALHDRARAEAQDIVFGKEMTAGEGFEISHVAGRQNQDEICIPGYIIALHDFGRGQNGGLEAVQIGLAFVLQAHFDNQGQSAPDASGIKDRDFSLDDPGASQPRHTLAAGIRRQSDLLRHRLGRGAGALLQDIQDMSVESVHRGR